jgi:hypothetical protein
MQVWLGSSILFQSFVSRNLTIFRKRLTLYTHQSSTCAAVRLYGCTAAIRRLYISTSAARTATHAAVS